MQIQLTAEELRYVIRCGAALVQNIPNISLPTYCGFDKDQIVEFNRRMRDELDKAGLDM
ncbi:hypothetical protein ABIE89_008177 [Bradyrhizobium niftali]|uniref:hypothetical protein n=1 Tax=Bradyrhizobium niftali TaxID=2560055 RepID=UPI003833A69F